MQPHVWHKSSRSGNANCVMAMRLHDGSTLVKDSKDPDGPVLSFTRAEWHTFIEGVKQSDCA